MARTRNLGNLTDLLSANTTTGIVSANTAPAQFDNSSALATTGWTVANSLRTNGLISESTSRVLTLADAGIYHAIQNNITLTLPALSTVPAGTAFIFDTNATVATLTTTGTDTFLGGTSSNVTSIQIKPGECMVWISSNGSAWHPLGTNGGMVNTGSFQASFANPGYQKLPTGLIFQWGENTIAAQTATVITLPIAYTTSNLGAVVSGEDISVNTNSYRYMVGSRTKTQITIFNGWTAQAIAGSWISWGY